MRQPCTIFILLFHRGRNQVREKKENLLKSQRYEGQKKDTCPCVMPESVGHTYQLLTAGSGHCGNSPASLLPAPVTTDPQSAVPHTRPVLKGLT